MMIRDFTFIVGLCLACGLSACDDEASEPQASSEFRTEPFPDGGAALQGEVCSPRVMVARRTDSTCTNRGAWTAARVFPGSGVDEMDRFCRYTWSNPNTLPTNAQIANLANPIVQSGGRIAPDCQAVTPETNVLEAAIGDELIEMFRWSAGRRTSAEVAAAYPSSTRSPVTVAVIDTYPTLQPADPISEHGPVVMSIVEEFACPEGVCPVNVESYLGLPRTDEKRTVNPTKGGVIGTYSDLATGIHAAVRGSQGAQRVVLNMSVGWDTSLFGGEVPTGATPAIEAVFTALQYARCSGALILVAVGNHAQMSCDEEALAPARWEASPAPSAGRCQALSVPNSFAAGEPLLYAVGGLDWASGLMPGSRDGGQPRLIASGTRATAMPRQGLPEPAVRTGTSIATAVASGTASLIWSLDPTLSAASVMDVLYGSGTAVGTKVSDFGIGGGGDPVRAVNACRAVVQACGSNRCGPINLGAALDCNDAPPITKAELFDLIVAAETQQSINHSDDVPVTCPSVCGMPHNLYGPPGVEVDCQDHTPDPSLRFTNPQPGRAGCSACGLTIEASGDAVAHLTLEGDFAAYPIETATLNILDAGNKVSGFALTDELRVENNPPVYISKGLSSQTLDAVVIEASKATTTPASATLVLKFVDGYVSEDSLMFNTQ